jgi:(p)ppGpp synthase/HD superfamily hydrolase
MPDHLLILKNLVLTPYMLKATALIGVKRKVGGNQFRHSYATLAILMDYKYFEDSVLLKASILHDLIEELGYDHCIDIYNIDSDGPEVLKLVLEVTRNKDVETKEEYLNRLKNSSKRAKIIKCADRISNLTDLNLDIYSVDKAIDYLNQTEKYILPLAKEVDENFVKELTDLITERRKLF